MTDENDALASHDRLSDFNAEFGLIGRIMGENGLMSHAGFMTPAHFASPAHADIWQAMVALQRRGDPIDVFTIRPHVESPDLFTEAGGVHRYLVGSLSASLTITNPLECARYLVRLSQKRRLVAACEAVARNARRENDPHTAVEHAMTLSRAVDEVTVSSPLNDFSTNAEVTEQIIEDLKDNRQPFSTGLAKLDMAMDGGLYPGKSYGFAARKKVGKTALAATISANLNQGRVKHLFICGEMSPKEIQQRILARVTESFPSAFRSDYGESGDFSLKLAEAHRTMPRCTLYRNAPGLTFDELRHVCTAAVERHGCKGIILDYWQLVGGKAKNQSTAEHLDEVAQWIADFGRKHGVWTITMAQVNQEGNTRGGEGIRLAFDQVYQLNRENMTKPDAWIEMMETRYTKWMNIGDASKAGLFMCEKGPYYAEALW